MTETIHIFDEFPDTASDVTTEMRHQKRMKIEPLVFDILKKKYGSTLDTFWETTGPGTNSENCILIVDRRVHENFDFCLKNAAYFGRDWSICVVCSEKNIEYCRLIAGKHVDKIHWFPYFRGSPGRDEARQVFIDTFKDANFYKQLPWKHLIVMHLDAYFRKPIPKNILNYDYIAAPTTWDENLMVGGMSFRNCDAMIRICEEFKEDIGSEDVFLDVGARRLGMRVPDTYTALEFASESVLYEDPVGVHQWWTFFYREMEDAEEFFHNYLRLEIV